jgi:hypothetical protein
MGVGSAVCGIGSDVSSAANVAAAGIVGSGLGEEGVGAAGLQLLRRKDMKMKREKRYL